MIRIMILACTFTLAGCSLFRMGENVLFVSGDVSNRSSETCEVHLFYESESSARSYNIQSVSGSFTVDYVVAPTDEQYAVEVICNGKVLVHRVAQYPDEADMFNLGEIH